MNTFVDCPKCGSEFMIDEDIMSSNLRCPDCLQWIDTDTDFGLKSKLAGYANRLGSDYLDELEYGYDY